MLGEAEIEEFAADGAPGTKVAEVVKDPSPDGVRKPIVFAWATVDLTVPEVCPAAFVAPGFVIVFPVPVAERVGLVPTIGLLNASRRVIETVVLATPFAVMPAAGAAEIEEFAGAAAPATNVTEPSVFVTGEVIVRAFVSATVERRVQFEAPAAFVAEQAP